MFEFRWIKTFLQLILLLHFTGETRQDVVSVIVREGDDVTLPCGTVTSDLHDCAQTTWSFSPTPTSPAGDLVVHGQVTEKAKAKSDRLGVTENCSLVVKKVTVEDVGRYICSDIGLLDLSVIKVTEHKDDDKVTLNCSVWTRGQCRHTVNWLFMANDVGTDNSDLKTTQSTCSSNVTFTTSHFIYTSKNYNLLKCNVTDGYNRKALQFTFKSEPSGSGNETPRKPERDIPQKSPYLWWLYIVAAVGLAALLITAVALVRRKRNKGNKTQREENMADHEDVSYTSVTFTKTNSKARVRVADEAVTYSTVKTPSSSAGASIDPKSLYTTIN